MDLDTLYSLIGDIPVSEQIGIAIEHHTHDNYVTRDEVEELKQKIEELMSLVGDVSVSEQISIAINNIK